MVNNQSLWWIFIQAGGFGGEDGRDGRDGKGRRARMGDRVEDDRKWWG